MTISKAFDEFQDWGSAYYAARTFYIYVGLIKKFMNFIDVNKDINALEVREINNFVKNLKKRNYAESTISYCIISLRVFFKYLHRMRIINWDYELIKADGKYCQIHFPTVRTEQALEMMGKVNTDTFEGVRDFIVQRFLFATGLRSAEIASVKIQDLNFEDDFVIVMTKKSKKFRIVPWDEVTRRALLKYLELRKKYAVTDHLIISLSKVNFGRGVSTRTIQRIIVKYRLPGMKTVPHSYRSGLATDMLENEIDLRTIQTTLGHSSIYSLEPYARLTNPHLLRQYKKVRNTDTLQDDIVNNLTTR